MKPPNKDICALVRMLARVITGHYCPTQPEIDLRFGLVQQKQGNKTMVTKTITNEQFVNLKVSPKTKGGHVAKIDGELTFSVTSGDATIRQTGPDSADLISGDIGTSEISVDGDADLGEGKEEISLGVELVVEGAKAEHFDAVFGEPQDKTA